MRTETRLPRALNTRTWNVFAALMLMVSAMPVHGQILNEQIRLVGSDIGEDDRFGQALAISGNTAVVGAGEHGTFSPDGELQSGALFVFVRQDNGTPDDLTDDTWTEQAELRDSDTRRGAFFGDRAVAIDGDTIVAGRRFAKDVDGVTTTGAAYVFVRSGDPWTEQQKLTADLGASGDQFGTTVAIDGDTIVVGAVANDTAGTNAGAAFVFVRTGSTWTQQDTLTASDPLDSSAFGTSVGISSNTIAVGAAVDIAPAVYVFVRSGGTWTEQWILTADDGFVGDSFAANLALDGDTVIVTAHTDDDRGDNSGSAYVFVRNGVTWSPQQKLLAADGALNDRFGFSISRDGDTALIGGIVKREWYIFRRTGSQWMQKHKLIPSDGPLRVFLPLRGVSISGNTALVGSPSDGVEGAGAAYVFDLEPAPVIQTELAKLLPSGAAASGARFGDGVTTNADGTVVLVGAA